MRVVDVVGSGDPALGGDGYKTSYLINSMMIHPQNKQTHIVGYLSILGSLPFAHNSFRESHRKPLHFGELEAFHISTLIMTYAIQMLWLQNILFDIYVLLFFR